MAEATLRDVLTAVNGLAYQLTGVANRLTALEQRMERLEGRMEEMHLSLASKLDAWELVGVVEQAN